MADPIQDSLLREIDEDLRQEKYAKLWKQYGKYVIAAAVMLVLGVAGYQGWRSWDIKHRMAESTRFMAALQLENSNGASAARQAMAKLAANASTGYATLARFQEAALMERSGNLKGAIAAYRALSTDSSVPESFRHLAVILGAYLEVDTADPAKLASRVAPLAADHSPWRFSALEINGLLDMRTNQVKKAREIFNDLAGNPSVPQGIRGRAIELLAILG